MCFPFFCREKFRQKIVSINSNSDKLAFLWDGPLALFLDLLVTFGRKISTSFSSFLVTKISHIFPFLLWEQYATINLIEANLPSWQGDVLFRRRASCPLPFSQNLFTRYLPSRGPYYKIQTDLLFGKIGSSTLCLLANGVLSGEMAISLVGFCYSDTIFIVWEHVWTLALDRLQYLLESFIFSCQSLCKLNTQSYFPEWKCIKIY